MGRIGRLLLEREIEMCYVYSPYHLVNNVHFLKVLDEYTLLTSRVLPNSPSFFLHVFPTI